MDTRQSDLEHEPAEPGFSAKRYRGTSMYPTLRCGDVLFVEPIREHAIRKGDVIVFRSQDHDGLVVHRVLRRDFEGYTTLGDNNAGVDRLPLRFEAIIGKVSGLQREKIVQAVPGGVTGRVLGYIMRMRARSARWLARGAQPTYRGLERSGILRRLVPGLIRFRIVSFSKPQGTELQLFMGKKCIGRLPAGLGRWNIRRPFRLIVDEEALPRDSNHNQDRLETGENGRGS